MAKKGRYPFFSPIHKDSQRLLVPPILQDSKNLPPKPPGRVTNRCTVTDAFGVSQVRWLWILEWRFGCARKMPSKVKDLAVLCDLFGMVKRPFSMVKWPPTRGWKGHFESPGIVYCGGNSSICLFQPCEGFHDPIWLAHIFQMGGEKPPTSSVCVCVFWYLEDHPK